MKRMLIVGGIWSLSWAAVGGADAAFSKEKSAGNFSAAVRAEDFAAAGLGKLSPEELARLDALVREFGAGTMRAGVDRSTDGGRPAKTSTKPAPRPAADDTITESRIAGDFRGWDGRPVFTLENGERWQVANAEHYYSPTLASPKVKIVPAITGGYWMSIDGVSQRVRVVKAGPAR